MDIKTTKERLQAMRSGEESPDRAVMLGYMMQLDEQYRRVLVAKYYNGCSWKQIQAAQGYTNSQCRRRYVIALKKLTEIMAR